MSAPELRCRAPAKINLFLHVTGRRPDGYHLLQSVFRLVDWWDIITLRLRDDGEIRRCNEVPGVPAAADLMVRAASLLQAESGTPFGVDLSIEKRLPMGGGLGGGSSDAATVMLALNRLWQLGFDRPRMMRLGLALGADVPFFLFGADAFVEGVGERIRPIELPPAHYVVLAPQVHVPTGEIFSASELTRNTAAIRMADFAASTTRNDLEAVVRLRYPEVDRAIRWLEQFGPARMTGSGACVFAQCWSESESLRIADLCPAEWQARSVSSLGRHPLQDWVCD